MVQRVRKAMATPVGRLVSNTLNETEAFISTNLLVLVIQAEDWAKNLLEWSLDQGMTVASDIRSLLSTADDIVATVDNHLHKLQTNMVRYRK